MTIQPSQNVFSEADMRAFEPAMKIGLLATVNPAGQPHLTLISSLKAGTQHTVLWGQFIEGVSKEHIHHNPKTAFMIMTLDKQVWRGKATWTHAETGGPDYEWYNNVPMFRYNAYFGIHTVHYMDLVAHTGEGPLPMNAIVVAAIKTVIAKTLAGSRGGVRIFNPWTKAFFDKIDNLKFLSFVDDDGYPWIIPAVQTQTDGSGRLLLSTGVYSDELAKIPAGAQVAVLGMALSMEDVLVRGSFTGIQRKAGISCAGVEVDWVYNCMPPAPGQIYPPLPLRPVEEF